MYYLEYLKKYMWIARLLAVALVAFLCANAVSIKIRGRLSDSPSVDLTQVTGSASAFTPLSDYEMILKRSLFYSDGMNMEASFNKNMLDPLKTAEDFELLGTLAGPPRDSYAIIRTISDGLAFAYQIGDEIGKSKATVLDIQPRVVVLLHNDEEKVIRMPDTPGVGVARRWAKRGSAETIAEGIKKLNDGEFVIDQNLIEDAFENMGSLMRGARIVPKLEKGKIVGFKVFRIKKNSLYKKIGLQNGDIIHRINSVEFSGPEDMLRLFNELKSAKNITIDVTRKKERMTLNYQVR